MTYQSAASLNFRKASNGMMEIMPKWISIEDGFPPIDLTILAFSRDYGIILTSHWLEDADITHWMPLPLPPDANI